MSDNFEKTKFLVEKLTKKIAKLFGKANIFVLNLSGNHSTEV